MRRNSKDRLLDGVGIALDMSEVLVHLACGRIYLALVLRSATRISVGNLAWMIEKLERDLTDRHAGPETDRQRCGVGKLQGDRAVEARVDEASRRMDHEPESAERGLPLQSPDDVRRQLEPLDGGAKNELTGMQDEWLVAFLAGFLGQVWLLKTRVDMSGSVVAEDSEAPARANVDRRRLDVSFIERIDTELAVCDERMDRSIAEDGHARR